VQIKITVKTRDRMGTYSLPSHVLGTVLAAENFTVSSTTGDTCPGAVAARGLMIGLMKGITTGIKYSSMREHLVGGASDKPLLMITRSDQFANVCM